MGYIELIMRAHIIRTLTPGKTMEWYHLKKSSLPFEWHYHPDFELLCCVRGTCRAVVGSRSWEMQAGELCFLGPLTPHAFHTLPGTPAHLCELFVMRFSAERVGLLIREFPENHALADLADLKGGGFVISRKDAVPVLRRVRRLGVEESTERLVNLLRLLAAMASAKKTAQIRPSVMRGRGYDVDRLNRISEYIEAHFRGEVRLADLARHAACSVSNLCAFFRRSTGMPVIDYVNEMRISYACKLLTATGVSITEIAFKAGYQSLSHFNRQFRKLTHTTPTQFRRTGR